MPGFDRTGPLGEGPFTGGGMGFCRDGHSVFGAYPRRFWLRRTTGGRGWRNWYYATGLTGCQREVASITGLPPVGQSSSEEGVAYMKKRAEFLRRQLADLEERIARLENNTPDTK